MKVKTNVRQLCLEFDFAKKDSAVQRKTIVVGLVLTLAVNVFIRGDFGDIWNLLSLKVTFKYFYSDFKSNFKSDTVKNTANALMCFSMENSMVVKLEILSGQNKRDEF